jgi:hypothetical protein
LFTVNRFFTMFHSFALLPLSNGPSIHISANPPENG